LFASEVVGIAAVHGNFLVTLASVRFEEPVGNQPPKVFRVVTGRLCLTSIAANQMLQNLQQVVTAQIKATDATVADHKSN